MRSEVTLPPCPPSTQHLSFGSISSSCMQTPLRWDNLWSAQPPSGVGLGALVPSPPDGLGPPHSLPQKKTVQPLLSLHPTSTPGFKTTSIFFIKSESHREGMTWLLQLIFFPRSNRKVQFPLEEGVSCRGRGLKNEGLHLNVWS